MCQALAATRPISACPASTTLPATNPGQDEPACICPTAAERRGNTCKISMMFSKGQNLALTVLCVPFSLGIGRARAPHLYHTSSVVTVDLHKSIPAQIRQLNCKLVADLCGHRLLQNDFINTFCEVRFRGAQLGQSTRWRTSSSSSASACDAGSTVASTPASAASSLSSRTRWNAPCKQKERRRPEGHSALGGFAAGIRGGRRRLCQARASSL